MFHRAVVMILSVLIGLTFVLAYSMSRDPGLGWIHLLGLGLSVLLLLVISVGRMPAFSKSPPE